MCIRDRVERKLSGENSNQLALHFHKGLACMIVSACEKAREETGIDTVALSGGVYPVSYTHLEAAKWLTKDQLDSVTWLPADILLIDQIRKCMK